jgi:hypothetical protein
MFIEGEHAWNFTPPSFAVAIISLILGILIFVIFFCIMDVTMLLIPGIIPSMFGIGRAGLPTGEIFSESMVFFVIMFMPQKVKYRCTSMPIAAAVVANINGG